MLRGKLCLDAFIALDAERQALLDQPGGDLITLRGSLTLTLLRPMLAMYPSSSAHALTLLSSSSLALLMAPALMSLSRAHTHTSTHKHVIWFGGEGI